MASENGAHVKIDISDKCPSCGLKWVDHMGVIFICADNQRLRSENERLKAELKKIKAASKKKKS